MDMNIQMVDLKNQYEKIKEEIDAAIAEVIGSSAFIKGPFVERFSHNLGKYLNCTHVIPCGNGTDALQLALMALDLEPGDEVITTPFTFVATAETIVLLGLVPVFVDIEPDSFNIDPGKIERAITDRTRCIIPVHLFGQSCDMQPILEIARRHELKVIEDTAQSIGAYNTMEGNKEFCGTIGDLGTLSFFPSKNLGAFGDGGAVCTSDDQLAEKVHLFANHGSLRKYYYNNVGINSRLDGIQAAVLDVKLRYLDTYNRERQKAAAKYDELLSDIEGIRLPVRLPGRNHVFHQYTILIEEGRDAVKDYLLKKDVPCAVYYPAPLYSQSVYRPFKSKNDDYAVTESMSNSVLSLPMHTELNDDMQAYIADSLRQALAHV